MDWWEAGQFYKTEDGGITWNQIFIFDSSVNISSIYFMNKDIGWIAGTHLGIAKTTDGGKTWNQENKGIQSNLINSVYFFDEKTGWATDYTGIIYKWYP
ncbi:MAG: hypothetical protein IPH20_18065 [Bacteroidales bacterium]|nr:hypothetical protein [Bacteroidales bacterium]